MRKIIHREWLLVLERLFEFQAQRNPEELSSRKDIKTMLEALGRNQSTPGLRRQLKEAHCTIIGPPSTRALYLFQLGLEGLDHLFRSCRLTERSLHQGEHAHHSTSHRLTRGAGLARCTDRISLSRRAGETAQLPSTPFQ